MKTITVTLTQKQLEAILDTVDYADTRKGWDRDEGYLSEEEYNDWENDIDSALAAINKGIEKK
jgi:PHD/YefM family antitoxin component YafN of YafNO toxin-antitoxin module